MATMRRIVLGTFLLAEIAGILVYIALDGTDDIAAFGPDGKQFGDMLSQAYEDIAWADAVRRSMLAEGGQEIGAGIWPRDNQRIHANGPYDGRLMPVGAPAVPLAAASRSVISAPERNDQPVSGTGQNR
jgi:hypothetical protein